MDYGANGRYGGSRLSSTKNRCKACIDYMPYNGSLLQHNRCIYEHGQIGADYKRLPAIKRGDQS